MTFKDFYKREVYVAMHAQSRKFRIVKYLVLSGIAFFVYLWKDLNTLGILFLIFFFIAIAMHFFFRWKTRAWTKSWGLYKKIHLGGE